MQYRFILGGLVAAFAITACSKHESQPTTPQVNCDQPQLTDQIQRQLQQNITQHAREFAQQDVRHFVDADKIIAAASQLTVNLTPIETNDSQTDQTQCHRQLTVTIPDAILQQAQSNAPLIFGKTSFTDQLAQQIGQTDIKFNDHSFTQNLTYVPANNTTASAPATSLPTTFNLLPLSQLLETTLLPYGVKDILVINGKTYSRAEAQAFLFNQTPLSQEAQMASAVLNGNKNQAPMISTNTNNNKPNDNPPVSDNTPQVSDNDLAQARDNHRNASDELDRLWHDLDQTVQNTLSNEQQQWQTQRKQQCPKSAANASVKDTELNYLQCDTRLINKRLEYLHGYSLP